MLADIFKPGFALFFLMIVGMIIIFAYGPTLLGKVVITMFDRLGRPTTQADSVSTILTDRDTRRDNERLRTKVLHTNFGSTMP